MTPSGLGKRVACHTEDRPAKRRAPLEDTALKSGDGQSKQGGDADDQPEDVTPIAEETRCMPTSNTAAAYLMYIKASGLNASGYRTWASF